MCGIFATVGWHGEIPTGRILELLRHRGPDSEGLVELDSHGSGRVVLASTRLAIRDLSHSADMPMWSPDRRYLISYNGEIYNARDLRRRFESAGRSFLSNSDTEVVLAAYEALGDTCTSVLEGMFAFAIWDTHTDRLFLARDHFGIKPLYYTQHGRSLAVASEIKPLLALGVRAEVDPIALNRYLTMLWVPDPLTMYHGIYGLEPGHQAIFEHGQLTVRPYWDVPFVRPEDSLPEGPELIERFRHEFTTAVHRQMVSDVPLGAFLSAGLDSSSIVAAMAEKSSTPVKTFTIAFTDEDRRGYRTLDDPAVAARTARHFGCDHTQIDCTPQVSELLPKVVEALEVPLADPATIPAFLVNQEAKRSVTVLLSGIGGDEVLGGYRKYAAQGLLDIYRHVPEGARGLLAAKVEHSPASRLGGRWYDVLRLVRKFVITGASDPVTSFIQAGEYMTPTTRHSLLGEACQEATSNDDPWNAQRAAAARSEHLTFLSQMQYIDIKTFLPALNLTYNDRMSMTQSTEVRVPFLDVALVRFLATLPTSARVSRRLRPTTKVLLRAAMKDQLPKEVLSQPKAGFGMPIRKWLAGPLNEMVMDLLGDAELAKNGILRQQAIDAVVHGLQDHTRDEAMHLWQLITLELWYRSFVRANEGRS